MKSTYPKIVMYSRNLCSDCIRSKNFLEKNEIPFEEINIIENPEFKETVESLNNGRQTVPTIIIENQSEKIILSEPSDAELLISIKKLSY
ncbi:MAG: glutaredoxin family protein [Chloroflexota bacterium]|jgi:Glutaredoxin and related proteins|nr:glutaredoxin family protein [Chloroflexota bacterium]|tara:strand:- start:279 stop:548 length:270 start_codon:yes stop_codon:yes gene_type:complete